jgi:hypothetical protein
MASLALEEVHGRFGRNDDEEVPSLLMKEMPSEPDEESPLLEGTGIAGVWEKS